QIISFTVDVVLSALNELAGPIPFATTVPVIPRVLQSQFGSATGLTNPSISNPFFIDTVSRTYLLLANNGVCSDTLQQTIIVQNLPSGTKNTQLTCLDSSFILFPPQPSGSTYFHWSSSPQFTDTLNNYPTEPNVFLPRIDKDTTIYLHRKNDVCEEFDTVQIVTSHYKTTLDSIPTICLGDSLLVNLKIISSSYSSSYTNLWHIDNGSLIVDTSDFKAWLKPNGPTDVHIVTTNEYGCQVKTTEHISTSKVEPVLTKIDISCFGANNGKIAVTCKDTTMPYSYTWTPAVSTTNIATDLTKGIYKVVVADTHHCVAETSGYIDEPDKIQLKLYDTVTSNFCGKNCIGKGSVQIQGGTPPYTYRWNTGATSTTIDQLCVGTYSFYLSDSNACLDTISFNVLDTSKLSIDYQSEMPTCYDTCDGKFVLLVENATYPITITWNDGGNDSVRNTLCRGNYQVEVIDSLLCKRQLNFTLAAPEPISLANYQVTRPSCKGYSDGSIIVAIKGGTPPYTYSWNGTIGTDSLLDIQAAQYQLHVTDINHCEYDTTFIVPDYDSLRINNITTTNIPCEEVCNATIFMNITGGCPPYRYILNGKETTSLDNLCKGTYQIKVLDRNNCSVQDSTVVKDSSSFPTPIKAWADTNLVYKGRSTMLHVTDLGTGFTYHWTPEQGLKPTSGTDVTATLTENTLFTVLVKDKWGCYQTDTVSVATWEVICDEPFVFVPNAFTPNDDGNNDILYVRGDLLEEIDFKVYDRWGEKIFETQDLKQGWDGTYKGKACEPGVYFYYLQATCSAGVKSLIKGNVTLIR
ncbi:MAG: gliding motility-associated C-terminal domain-containing protein, partial [Bacteroidales bacterium]|nr:gliding motility-associated C-terminal domain-containing protein [Bacteroidales bacterium]